MAIITIHKQLISTAKIKKGTNLYRVENNGIYLRSFVSRKEAEQFRKQYKKLIKQDILTPNLL